MKQSCRWKTSAEADVDAYFLTDGSWMLFAYLKTKSLENIAAYAEALRSEFAGIGQVSVVARALKIEGESRPLDPIWAPTVAPKSELWTKEGWLLYRLEAASVLNPGLFIDQRENRRILASLVQMAASQGVLDAQDSMLNLFSYTGSFSMAALCGGARSTTSVDVSSRYLAWEKQNSEGNYGGHDIEHRMICDDARDFLRRAAKKNSRYRWIVIDPPTFSRGQKKPFKVRDELIPMLREAVSCLVPEREGAVLASTNDGGWEPRKFFADVDTVAREVGARVIRGAVPSDFGPSHPLKSAWLLKTP